MPGAGFYPIGTSRIVFGRDGRWYADGERIDNPSIARLFSRHLTRCPDGTYAIVMGDERAAIEVEDTAWVVTRIDGAPERGFAVTLNDDTEEPLDPRTLEVGPGNVLYCRVKGAAERARILRPAYYALARHVEATAEPERFTLEVTGCRYMLTAGRALGGRE